LKWVAEGAAECGLRFYGTYGEDESPLAQAVREAGLVFKGRISRPRFWDIVADGLSDLHASNLVRKVAQGSANHRRCWQCA